MGERGGRENHHRSCEQARQEHDRGKQEKRRKAGGIQLGCHNHNFPNLDVPVYDQARGEGKLSGTTGTGPAARPRMAVRTSVWFTSLSNLWTPSAVVDCLLSCVPDLPSAHPNNLAPTLWAVRGCRRGWCWGDGCVGSSRKTGGGCVVKRQAPIVRARRNESWRSTHARSEMSDGGRVDE